MNSAVAKIVRELQARGLLSRTVKHSGTHLVLSCPFISGHGGRKEQGTPPFGINEDTGGWSCFSCKKKGSSAHYLAALLLGKTQDEIEYEFGVPKHLGDEITEKLQKKALKTPHLTVPYPPTVSLDSSAEALAYVEGRGIPRSIWEPYHLEYCPAEYLPDYNGDLSITGRRIIIPVMYRGARIGYSARSIGKSGGIKYFRPIENIGQAFYDPSNVLAAPGRVWVVEGEMDVLVCLREGLPAVGLFGSNVSQAHAEALSKAKEVVFMLDPDEPGLNGVAEAIKKYGHFLNYRVYWLPEGMDPGSMPMGYGKTILEALEK